VDKDIPLSAIFLNTNGFTNPDIQYKIMRLHCIIRQSWHNHQHNSFGLQKESILKSNAFSSRLFLEKFNAPSIVNWYEHLTSTCKAFRIGHVPFNAIRFSRQHEELCIPGLSVKCYHNVASALCTAMPICLARANSRVQAMIAGIETKMRNGYEIV
jgi:hypothetical protein